MTRPARMGERRPRGTIVVALFVAALAIAACGGGTKKSGSPTSISGGNEGAANGATNVTPFCRDYQDAISSYLLAAGDVTGPDFASFLTEFTKVTAEAPKAIKRDVSTMLDNAKSARK